MQIETTTLRKAVDNAFLQEPITEAAFETFRQQLVTLLGHADTANEKGESEEHLKNLIKPFFGSTSFGDDHYINTKDRQDLAIHNGKTSNSSVGVIIEAKRPSNKEMITRDDLNRKAFQEAILYYLRERIENKNDDIKHLIITDVYGWYIFDAQDFERHFYESKKLRDWYNEWKQGQKVSSRTKFVYQHLSEFVEELDESINAAQVNIDDYRRLLKKEELSRDEQKKLVPLFKLFTPTHLLKLPFASDSNKLNKGFYRELLYIMGLKEYKEKGTHYITRLDEENRQHASLIENTITQLESLNMLSRLPNRRDFGKDKEEQLFNVAIQLLITWINRILFLKLLEAQLYKYHREDEQFRFLSHRQIKEYDGLNKLFFQVLAVPFDDRSERINKHFGHIPYLNSSLFDVAEIEQHALRISELEDGLEMEVHNRSKIRNRDGERLKDETLSALEYLLRFIDAYNFNTEGTAEVQKEAKTLINASVLGRIFEKINGYKDGSFFTPGYITEYMCRETIRRAVVQKFNETYEDWNCETIDEVTGKISRHEVPYPKANEIVNSITICDPAVGSGHFLVSALNELIAIKSDLRIFVDEDNHRIRDVEISVDNDELSIAAGQDPFFEYRVFSEWKGDGRIKRTVGHDTQRLQKALFREKNILIENCLFGVDINPNSVNICRLRLWIELLKHAYYREETDYQSLQVLPNIDINIKQGNSLVSRFNLKTDLSSVFKDSEHSVEDYKQAVNNYKKTKDRTEKQRLQQYINDIKEEFTVSLSNLRPINKKISKARGNLEVMQNADLFGEKKFSKKDVKKQEKEVQQLEEQKAEEESGVIYNQAFEWRFEFPEILDEDGNYTGFDAVIGNPPYVRQEQLKDLKEYFKDVFEVYQGTADLYQYFIERGMNLLKDQGLFHYIVSNKWMKTNYGQPLREWLQQHQIKSIIDFGDLPVFQEATTYPCLLQLKKDRSPNIFKAAEVDTLEFDNLKTHYGQINFEVNQSELLDEGWSLISKEAQVLLRKIKDKGEPLGSYVNGEIYRGILTGLNEAFIINEATKEKLIQEDSSSEEFIKPFLKGRDINRYNPPSSDKYLILIENGWTNLNTDEENKWPWFKKEYPAVADYLDQFKEKAKKRYDQGEYWWELRACSYYDEFEQPKIILPDICKRGQFTLDTTGEYYMVNTAYMICSKEKYLLGVLCSDLVDFFYRNISSKYRGDYLRFIFQYLEQIPIVEPDKKEKQKIESLVDQILTAKEDNPEADTSKLEAEIDQLVYELYGLSEEEVAIVEGSM